MKVFSRLFSLILCCVVLIGHLSVPAFAEESSQINAVSGVEIASGACGNNLTWRFDSEGVLTISGKGRMFDYLFLNGYGNVTPWYSWRYEIESVVIEDGVTNIGEYAFYSCTNLKSITIPKSVSTIGLNAFLKCHNLTDVYITDIGAWVSMDKDDSESSYPLTCNDGQDMNLYLNGELITDILIPSGITSIADYAFFRCKSITSVTLPDSLLNIGGRAFVDCSNLNSIVLPDGIKTIGDFAFAGSGLETVLIPNTLEELGGDSVLEGGVFKGCKSLKTVDIPEGITSIPYNSFCGCSALESVSLPSTLESISSYAFEDCTSLKTVDIPGSVKKIGSYAFNRCYALSEVRISTGAEQIGSGAFSSCYDLKDIYIPVTVTTIDTTLTNNVTIWGCPGSTAETFAEEHGYTFREYHTYTDADDTTCDCGYVRPSVIPSVPMFRMYDPNGGEHFYTGSEEERDGLVAVGWNYEGVAFNFPAVGTPVHRLYNPVSGDHLYTMDEAEMNRLLAGVWNYEGVAFNSATSDQVPQYRLWNPNAVRGAWHFTGSTEERDWLISLGWQYQGIGWYSEWK